MNIRMQSNSLLAGNKNIFQNGGLKSTQEKLQRQEKRDNQIAFLENQKNNLKNMKGDSLEDISRKLEMLHSYEDQIAAAKEEYNNSQMFRVLEEARERGEQIAKAAEKYAPKTPEERLEELVEEARGTEESKGILTETMEELAEMTEEIMEEMTEELTELTEELPQEELSEQLSEELTEEAAADAQLENTLIPSEAEKEAAPVENTVVLSDAEKINEFHKMYRKLDIRV